MVKRLYALGMTNTTKTQMDSYTQAVYDEKFRQQVEFYRNRGEDYWTSYEFAAEDARVAAAYYNRTGERIDA